MHGTVDTENQKLRDRLFMLEAALGFDIEIPPQLKLSRSEGRLLAVLLKRDFVGKDQAGYFLYAQRPDCEIPTSKTVEVFLHHIRRKLRPYNIEIQTKFSEGYWMDEVNKTALRTLIATFKGQLKCTGY